MKVTHDDLWLCHDCAIVTVNGDWSGVDDGSPEGAKIRRRIEQGLGELGATRQLLNGDLGSLDGGTCDATLYGIARMAGFSDEDFQ